MEEITTFEQGRQNLVNFIRTEYDGFDNLLLSHFLNSFNMLLDYVEEGNHTKPKIIFTNNIDSLLKTVTKSYKLPVFSDDDASMFRSRLKPLIAIARKEWAIYVEQKEDKFNYGICTTLNSLKEKNLLKQITENNTLREKTDKIRCIIANSVNNFEMKLYSTSGNSIRVNTSVNLVADQNNDSTIEEFTRACFSKLRTTQKKLDEVRTMFANIFTRVIDDLNGAMCVVVDKDYKDNGFFEDGIWLESPISFSKLFTQSKSYSEEKLQAFASLLINMLNFDGITVVDTTGRVLAYNVFVESNTKRTKNVIGGARKRAAYTVINSRRKHIVGLYFQSHEGEIFYKSLVKPKPVKQKTVKEDTEKSQAEIKEDIALEEQKPEQVKVEQVKDEKDVKTETSVKEKPTVKPEIQKNIDLQENAEK